MKAFFSPFRLATYLLVFNFIGHTFGGMLGNHSFGVASDAVFMGMKSVEFEFMGAKSSWYGQWFGLGMYASLFLVYTAWVAWWLDKASAQTWKALRSIAWGLLGAQMISVFLSWKYFFLGPTLIAALVSVCVAVGIGQKNAAAR